MAAKAKPDAPLRLVTVEDAVVFPADAEPTDDTPTIISKQQPLLAQPQGAPADFLTHDLRGKKLAHFELLEPIGVGGMAAVLRARDTQLDRLVALKILPPEMANDPDNVQRFHQEARAAAKLDHENIARVFFCGEEQGLHFIAFEYVEGDNLKSILEKSGPLPVAETVRYVLQIATGLEHAAARGVVHRDIKPSNIIISPNGRAKLVDMGLARSREVHKDKGLTQSGVTLGTFDYISPEQALEPRDADARSDIYSLGCTFYHMLTGQSPVPEGTAARKLHHHQHVAPLDPRQLNPEVPDEVALILARMMAKDPRARYQRPVHLVQHLLQVAQKVGAAADVPEGVLFVDAPLPAPPGQRPLLFVSLAILLLGVVLAILSLAPPVSGPNATIKKQHQVNVDKKPSIKAIVIGPKLANPGPGAAKTFARNEGELRDLLAAAKSGTEIFVKGIIELPQAGLNFEADANMKLVLARFDEREPAVLLFKVGATSEDEAGLNLNVDGHLTLRNLTFVLETPTTPENLLASIAVRGAGTVRFENCTFVQREIPLWHLTEVLTENRSGKPNAIQPMASVFVDNSTGPSKQRPKVIFAECVFKGINNPTTEKLPPGAPPGGQIAIATNGPVDIEATDCAFRPHLALFHLRGNLKEEDDPISIQVERCSAFLPYGPVFCIDDEARSQILVKHSIFSCPEQAFFDGPHLLLQVHATSPIVRFKGQHNCYHKIDKLWVYAEPTGKPIILNTLERFRGANGAEEIGSSFPRTVPFRSEYPLREGHDQDAFALHPDLRENRDPNNLEKGLGPIKCVWGPMPKLLPLSSIAAVANFKPGLGEKLVDPDSDGSDKSVHKTVHSAVRDAEPGDIIYIKPGKDGDLKVEPIRLAKSTVNFTLKPVPGTKPRLRLDDFVDEPDVAMFRLTDGEMTVEDLEFVVEPHKEGYKAQAVVQITGNAFCSFKNCKVTLKPREPGKAARPVELSMVTLPDLDPAMKMASTPPRSTPEILLRDCFVRGEGDLLNVRASRPVYADINNSLIALNGSLMVVEGAAKEPMPDLNAKLRIHLYKTSVYLTNPLLWLKGNSAAGKGLLPMHVEMVRESLFVGLGDLPAPLILFDAAEYDESALRKLFMWKGDDNAYLNLKSLLEHRRFEVSSSFSWDLTRWLDFTKETRSKGLESQLVLTKPLWESPAAEFTPMDKFGHRHPDAAPKTPPNR